MKKTMTCLLLVLLLAGCCTAVTASTADVTYQTYVNEPFGYQIDYPADWTMLDKDTIDYYMAQLNEQNTSQAGISASAMEAVKAQIMQLEDGAYVEFMAPRGDTVAIVCYDYPATPSMDYSIESLAPQFIAMYQTMFTDFTLLDSGSEYIVGDADFLKLQFETLLFGQTVRITALYLFQNDRLYSFAATWLNTDPETLQETDDIFETMLASFTLAQ